MMIDIDRWYTWYTSWFFPAPGPSIFTIKGHFLEMIHKLDGTMNSRTPLPVESHGFFVEILPQFHPSHPQGSNI
jgi:hypothetical protein